MKKFKFISLLISLVIFLGSTGCNLYDKIKDAATKEPEKKTITATNGKYELTLPETWKEDNQLNKEASIQVSNRRQEKYLVVIDESKEDFSDDLTLEEYEKFVKEDMEEAGKDMSAENNKEITVNGEKALYLEMTGTVEKVKVKYIVVIAQDKSNVYQIIGWTAASKFEENKREILSIIESLKSK